VGLPAGRRRRTPLRFVFLLPEARKLIAGWTERAERVVAEFRADSARWRGDPVTDALVAELCNASPDFNRHWRQHPDLKVTVLVPVK